MSNIIQFPIREKEVPEIPLNYVCVLDGRIHGFEYFCDDYHQKVRISLVGCCKNCDHSKIAIGKENDS